MTKTKQIGTFNKAMVALRKGLTITRPCWKDNSYWYLGIDEIIFYSGGDKATIHLNQIQANDWEVYEKPKPKKETPIKPKDKPMDTHVCYKCGQGFEKSGDLKKTIHHAIPRCLKPKHNIKIPVHRKCHEKINDTFIPKNKLEKIKKLLNEVE